MSHENELPLPDYDGGPRDKLRDAAKAAEEKARLKRLDDLADIRNHLRVFVSNEAEVIQAASHLYYIGYRRTTR
jgi:hypothetical protein